MVKDFSGRFLKVACARCGSEQILYGRATLRVKCAKCNKLLVEPGGGKVRVRTIVKRVY